MTRPVTEDDPERVGGCHLLFRVGEGEMGRVYVGVSPAGIAVTVKAVHLSVAASPAFRARFTREVRESRKVPGGGGVVSVVNAETGSIAPWLVSSYAPGPSLAEAVRAHGPLPERTLWRLLAGLVRALRAVHDCWVPHRGVKPSHVLLGERGPQLIEPGITPVGGMDGYAPPDPPGEAADVHALGAVLAYAATGTPHGRELHGVPPALRDIITRCRAKRPEDRPTLLDLRAIATRHDGHGDSWLPGPLARAVSDRVSALTNALDHRRRTLSPSPPPSPSPYATISSRPPRTPIHLRPDPRRRVWVAPWVQGGVLGRPLLSLSGLTLMAALLLLAPGLHDLARDHPHTPPGTGLEARLEGWSTSDGWRTPMTLLLCVVLSGLAYLRPRLHLHSVRVVRLWAAAGACYWLLWSEAVWLHFAWVWGIGASIETTGRPAALGWSIVIWLALGAIALTTPFVTITALRRLHRAARGDTAQEDPTWSV